MNSLLEEMSRTVSLARDLIVSGNLSDTEIVSAFTQTTIALVADEKNLKSVASQSALVTLFILVARLGCTVRLVLPRTSIRGSQPPLRGDELSEAFLDLGRDLIPGCLATIDPTPADLTFILGSTPWRGNGVAWRIGAEAWAGWITPTNAPTKPIQGTFPLGAMAAAALGAAEPFKAALRRLAINSSFCIKQEFTPLTPQARFELAPMGTPIVSADMGLIDIISGGAITNGVLYALLRIPGLEGTVRVIEPERLDLSNNNRYMLARASDCDLLKVEILKRYSTPTIAIEGVPARFTLNTQKELGSMATRAIVGTDDIPARWDAQRMYPEWLGVGATSHFLTMTSSHEPGQACAGCLHPYNEAGPAILPTSSFVSFWAGLLLATRLVRHVAGFPHSLQEQTLLFCPLLPDQPEARLPYTVPARQDCPLHCVAV